MSPPIVSISIWYKSVATLIREPVSNLKLEKVGWSPNYTLEDGIEELIKTYTILIKNLKLHLTIRLLIVFFLSLMDHNTKHLFLYQNKKLINQQYRNLINLCINYENHNY